MGLWRVDVAGMSVRMVEADTRESALSSVQDALIRALDLRVAPAPRVIAAYFDGLGPLQRRSFLAATDGLSSPQSRRSASAARRKLERLAHYDEELKSWSTNQDVPEPVDPEGLARLLTYFEVERIEAVQRRLKEHERRIHLDGDAGSGYSI